ncbi:MAG TPA: hypothetical protein VHW95_15810 [Steroidobacteraceae bacterium]|jgi:hypothetical protein|nr:hypothetical protein [Steroidobacteraceae bacterium]
MFDVHPPNASIHGWRDFFIHMATITIGLLIALGLEGTVEWFHHRHVMHQAEKSMLAEIKANAGGMHARFEELQTHQKELKLDIEFLNRIIANPKMDHGSLSLRFDINGFDNVSWATAQSTGAVAYMSYAEAREYSDIYSEQAEVDLQARQAVRDLTVALGPVLNLAEGPSLDADDARSMKQHIETLQGQIYLVDSLLHSMDKSYQAFLSRH